MVTMLSTDSLTMPNKINKSSQAHLRIKSLINKMNRQNPQPKTLETKQFAKIKPFELIPDTLGNKKSKSSKKKKT